jgi:hypothetical protein
MSTTTTITTEARAASSLATSTRFKNFGIVAAITFPICYVVCDIMNWPLFTYHPGTNRVGLFWEAARSGEGPAMYWYGWTATCLIASAILGVIGALLPNDIIKKIPLSFTWIFYILAVPFLVWSLMPFWTK